MRSSSERAEEEIGSSDSPSRRLGAVERGQAAGAACAVSSTLSLRSSLTAPSRMAGTHRCSTSRLALQRLPPASVTSSYSYSSPLSTQLTFASTSISCLRLPAAFLSIRFYSLSMPMFLLYSTGLKQIERNCKSIEKM